MNSVARIQLPTDKDELTEIWGALPGLGTAVSRLAEQVYAYEKSSLTARERECARMRVAQINDCPICLGWRIPSLSQQGVDEELYAHVSEYRFGLIAPTEPRQGMRTRELSLRHSARADRRFRESVRERKIGEPDRALGSLCQKLGVGGEI